MWLVFFVFWCGFWVVLRTNLVFCELGHCFLCLLCFRGFLGCCGWFVLGGVWVLVWWIGIIFGCLVCFAVESGAHPGAGGFLGIGRFCRSGFCGVGVVVAARCGVVRVFLGGAGRRAVAV